MSLRLVVEVGNRKQRFPLGEGLNQLGSSPSSDVRIIHPSVSRRHAVIEVRDGRAEIQDQGSRNGTRIAGRRLEKGQVQPLPVGERLSLGGVNATVEEVSEKDLQPAVMFPVRSPDPASPDPEGGAATASVGTARIFALKRLPGLLTRLTQRRSVADMAQAVGAALFETLPCVSVEVRAVEGDGLLFSARHDDTDRDLPHQAVATNERVVVKAALVHPSHARSYAPLVETGALLIQLAAASELQLGPPAPTPAPNPLPDPPTVVPEVRRIYSDAHRVSQGDVSVLIRGDSGTGKEVLARYLHASSPRNAQSFVALNCAALPRDLLESELFGIEQGVATGVASRAGKFEMASGGTLFLDEVGDMALETQARILRVLQEGEVYRLGGQEPRSADVRVVAATHRDIDAMLKEGSFRSDLYHRIADWTVRIPTLVERRADIPNLAAYFLARSAERRGLRVAGISQGAMELLESYAWPGNIRQLEREMARASLFLEKGELLESAHLQEAIRESGAQESLSLKDRLERVERREIEQALSQSGWNVSAAARELKMGLSTLYRRMRELGIEQQD
ncbi:MAG: sigma 54-interacting transcriptional regulator [Acidobacteriota bacterium]